ncbi:N-methyl-L-tryptophan oxidase [Leucobacter luti]|uniref:Sarcosine oxidase n=1 Tax=Leucobacter luti TaxID=340320 RepID=A0A4Q7U2K9_9MICO|nr:N-methyl-L-tryptophan oxidase [Leucobacter luti]MBL3699170.1 N-methyl-L-tryptophan oxidase [Leucobacter luti]RZT66668.1 sarcosine oxidase [Leucobacter luti]
MELQHTDVVVIGAGAVGSMALWQLSKREGLAVVGIEQYGRVHSHGSYAGESRVFRTAVHEGGTYVPMIQRSRELWRELERESGRDIYYEVGALSIAPEGFPDLLTAQGTVREFDLEHRMLSTEELRAEFPQHRVQDGDVGLLDARGGGLRPEVAIMSALDIAERNGAELHFNTPVIDIEERPNGVVVRTTQGAWLARTVVVASGSWSTRLSPELDELLRLQVLGLTWFMPKDPTLFVPERFPAFLRDAGSVHFFGAPSFDGYAFKACTNPEWPVFRDVAEVPTHHTREELIKIGQRAAELFEGINPEPVRESVHHCAYTPDRLPVVDLNASGRIVTVAGMSGHGFKFAPKIGEWAAQLVTDEDAGVDPRFALPAHMARLALTGPYTGGGH